MAGDAVSVPAGGRAELQLDYGDFVRIGGDTEIRISDLEAGRNQIQLSRGIITYRVLRDSNTQAEVSTPSVAVHPLRMSAVRVEVAPDGMTKVTVRRGEAEVATSHGSEHVREGNMMMVRGAADDPEYQVLAAGGHDAWDAWNDQRDSYLERAQSNRYVSPDINGAEDLDTYGRWGYDPAYGNVWTPSVAPGWAPYQNGQWVWQDYYGWTWVDYDPWGWAPFHYGSWYLRAGFGWSWFPGPRVGHYWYHPALVGFFGFGGGVGVGVGFGFGNVGWVALAPYERFHPWYGPGWYGGHGVVVNNVNIVRNVNVAGTYRNAAVLGGARAVAAADFQRGVFSNQIAVNRTQLAQASLVHGAVPLSPTSNNLRFTDRTAAGAGPRGEISNRRFFSRMSPGAGAAQRTPFTQQQAAVRSSLGERAGAERAGGASAGASGWQRFGEPSRSAVRPAAGGASQAFSGPSRTAPSQGNSPQSRGSWDRFGTPQGQGRLVSPEVSRPAYNGQSQRAPAPSYKRAPAPSYSPAAPAAGGGGQRGGGGGARGGASSHNGSGHR